MPSYDLKTIENRERLPWRDKPYWDTSEPNRHIGIRVRKDKHWVARCRTKSDCYVQTSFGPAEPYQDGISYDHAMRLAKQWFADCDAKKYSKPFEYPRYNNELTICPIGDVFTVGHALKNYVEWKRLAAAPTYFRSCLVLINYHLIPRIAQIPVQHFNSSHLNRLCVDVLETPPKKGLRPCGPKISIGSLSEEQLRKRKKTINTLISILRVAFELAYDNGDIDTDRPRRCLRRLPNYDRPRVSFLSREECFRLLDAAEGPIRHLILGALYTGCRVTELMNLRVKDVGSQCHGVFIRRAKNYQSRHVILPNEGMAFFLSQCDCKLSDEFVFLNRRGLRWGDQYRYLFRKAVDKAKLSPDVVFHTLRHTYASQLLQNGGSLTVLARQLGHVDVKTVHQIYGHLTSDTTLAELDRFFEDFGIMEPSEIRRRLIGVKKLRKSALKNQNPRQDAWPLANYSRIQGDLAGIGKPADY